MMTIARAIFTWFRGNDIDTDSLTIIINITDRRAASAFVSTFHKQVGLALNHEGQIILPRDFTILGIKFKFESPIDEGDSIYSK